MPDVNIPISGLIPLKICIQMVMVKKKYVKKGVTIIPPILPFWKIH
jgi:hypothetical protein